MGKKMNNERFEYLMYRRETFERSKKYYEKKGKKNPVKPLTQAEKKEIEQHLQEVIKKYHPRQ